jgi:hypothetical protein
MTADSRPPLFVASSVTTVLAGVVRCPDHSGSEFAGFACGEARYLKT